MSVVTIDVPVPQLSEESRTALTDADIIIGVDVHTQCEFTIFGTPPLESTISLRRPAAMRVVRVSIDGAAGELDRLIELVHKLKGQPG